ncbi:MAG: hypothetical protein KAX49_03845 [Halanaerobiales bacterium]|nr:hypothetical protein [Halanaerobiales bacterium]
MSAKIKEIGLKEYLGKQREEEEVILPSGLKVKIRKRLTPLRNLKILEEAGLTWDDMGTGLNLKNFGNFCKAGFAELFIKPKVPSELEAEDIEDIDFPILHRKLLDNFLGTSAGEVEGLTKSKKDEEDETGDGNKDFST